MTIAVDLGRKATRQTNKNDVEFAPSIVTDRPLTKSAGNDKDKETCNPESCNVNLPLRSGTRTEEEAQATVIEV